MQMECKDIHKHVILMVNACYQIWEGDREAEKRNDYNYSNFYNIRICFFSGRIKGLGDKGSSQRVADVVSYLKTKNMTRLARVTSTFVYSPGIDFGVSPSGPREL